MTPDELRERIKALIEQTDDVELLRTILRMLEARPYPKLEEPGEVAAPEVAYAT